MLKVQKKWKYKKIKWLQIEDSDYFTCFWMKAHFLHLHRVECLISKGHNTALQFLCCSREWEHLPHKRSIHQSCPKGQSRRRNFSHSLWFLASTSLGGMSAEKLIVSGSWWNTLKMIKTVAACLQETEYVQDIIPLFVQNASARDQECRCSRKKREMQ